MARGRGIFVAMVIRNIGAIIALNLSALACTSGRSTICQQRIHECMDACPEPEPEQSSLFSVAHNSQRGRMPQHDQCAARCENRGCS
jgi:hypothetical protein